MKIDKNGEIKLSSVDTKIGEFVISRFKERTIIQTTSRNWVLSFTKDMLIARFIDMFLNDGKIENVRAIITVLYNTTCVIPDVEYLDTLIEASMACMNRHQEIYGTQGITEEQDRQILQELRKDSQAAEALKTIETHDSYL